MNEELINLNLKARELEEKIVENISEIMNKNKQLFVNSKNI